MNLMTWSGVGLSPPTRGSLPHRGSGRRGRGSIPAHTGKPGRGNVRMWSSRVYPRPHGEAFLGGRGGRLGGGLSPPTRGSRRGHGRQPGNPGSIPAHTGKPFGPLGGRAAAGVYPRPHGEAHQEGGRLVAVLGLSPPTRGSRCSANGSAMCSRSIPAHTGKPAVSGGNFGDGRVYPRPHGEACGDRQDAEDAAGLSPPTRGSLEAAALRRRLRGSIPAHTGKPRDFDARQRPAEVYPRPHGEAFTMALVVLLRGGLSPPTRGSQGGPGESPTLARSIPAHTGKPSP